MEANLINVIDPDTQEIGSIPSTQLKEAQEQGYSEATPEQVHSALNEEKFGGLGQQALTGIEGAASAATFGASTGLERSLGVKPEDIRGRRETNPIAHMVGQGAGLVGSSLALPGGGAAGLLSKAGTSAAEAVGLGAAESGLAKIGSAAVQAAAENSIFQAGDEASKMLASDPDQSVQTAITNIGLSGLIGSGFGASFGAVSPLWQATAGPKVSSFLKSISDRAGGIEGVLPDELQNAIHDSGMTIAPEIKAGLSNDPKIKQIFQTLQESATGSGVKAQSALRQFKSDISNSLLESLGKTPEEVSILGTLSENDAGKSVKDALVGELKAQYEPISEIFKSVQEKFKDVPMSQVDQAQIAENIGKLIQEKGYYLDPSSNQAQIITKALDSLSNMQTLDDIRKYTSIINEKTNSPDLWRVGGDLRRIFRNAESEITTREVGEKAPEMLSAHAMGRTTYQDLMQTMDTLNDRLHVGKYHGPESFLSALKEMSPEDVLRRLSGKGDADLLKLVSERFPGAAAQIKDFHVNNVLKAAAARAPEGQAINSKILFNALDKMSPELKEFAFPQAGQFSLDNKFASLKSLVESMPEKMNTSGTAKTLDALWSHVPASVVGMATMLTGHNPLMAVMLGALTEWVGRDIPDATRLALLKFLGSGKEINSAGFKAMADFIDHTLKGENLIRKATKNIFKAGQEVIPSALIPSEKQRSRLDERLQKLKVDSTPLFDTGGKTPHYLPDHGQAMGVVAANATNYLNSLRPSTDKQAPLDAEVKPSKMQESEYQNALTLAEQPLVILNKIKAGTLTPQDVTHLTQLYPALKQRLDMKLTENLIETVNKNQSIPYATRMSLSLFLGQPLDSTMKPQGILASQPKPQGAPMNMSQPKHSMSALGKMPMSEMTASQAREARHLK